MSRNKEHRPNGAAAEGGRPIGAPPKAAPVFLIILYHNLCILIYMCPHVVYILSTFCQHFPHFVHILETQRGVHA